MRSVSKLRKRKNRFKFSSSKEEIFQLLSLLSLMSNFKALSSQSSLSKSIEHYNWRKQIFSGSINPTLFTLITKFASKKVTLFFFSFFSSFLMVDNSLTRNFALNYVVSFHLRLALLLPFFFELFSIFNFFGKSFNLILIL